MRKPVKGQCYMNNFLYLLNRWEREESTRGWRLCHGVATGSGPIAGVRFGHSWLEHGTFVYDASFDREMPKSLYYHVGEIGPVVRYTLARAKVLAFRYGTYGPWDMFVKNAAHAETLAQFNRKQRRSKKSG